MKYKVIEKINLKYDGEVLKIGDESDFSKLDEKEVAKLVDQKYIVEVPIMGTGKPEQPKEPTGEKKPDEGSFFNHEVEYLTEEQLKDFKTKDELIQYGESIGVEGLNKKSKLEDLVQTIFDYIEDLELEDDEYEDE